MLMVNQMTGFGEGWGNQPDLNFASWASGDLFNQVAQDTTTFSAVFSPDGTKMFLLGISTNTIYQYTISGGNIIGASYDSLSLSVAAQTTAPRGLEISSDGTKLYIGSSAGTIYQYTLPTAYSLSGASYSGLSFNASAKFANMIAIRFSADGTKLFGSNAQTGNSKIHVLTLSTAWVINTASTTSIEFDVWALKGVQVTGIEFSKSGMCLFFLGYEDNFAYQMDLTGPWDISSAKESRKHPMVSNPSGPLGMVFSADRRFMYISQTATFQHSII